MPQATSATAAGTIDLGGDLTVKRMGFGAMRITGQGSGESRPTATRRQAVLRRAVELGVNFIDTADAYGPKVSEGLIAEALHPYPDSWSSPPREACSVPVPANGMPTGTRASPRCLRGQPATLEAGQIPSTSSTGPTQSARWRSRSGPWSRCKDEGRSATSACPTSSEAEIAPGQRHHPGRVASRTGSTWVTARRTAVLDLCETGAASAFLPWAPDRAGRGRAAGPSRRSPRRHGASAPTRSALAWLLARSPAMLPIPGTSSVAHLEENIAAASLQLSQAEVDELGL